MTLGTKLINLRNERKLTLSELSENIGVSAVAIGKWEADKAKPGIDNLLKICDFYDKDIYDLLDDVSNVHFSNAKFKGNSYAAYAQNFTVNNSASPEFLKLIIENQNKISELILQQNKLIEFFIKK